MGKYNLINLALKYLDSSCFLTANIKTYPLKMKKTNTASEPA